MDYASQLQSYTSEPDQSQPVDYASKLQSLAQEPEQPKQAVTPVEEKGKLASFGAGAGYATGRAALAVQQILGKGLSGIGDLTGSETISKAGNWLNDDAVKGALKLEAENKPYEEANPKTNIGGQVTGLVLNPVNKLVPGGAAATYTGAALKGAAQGAVLNVLSTPVTEGDFVQGKLKQAALGGAGGAVGGTLAHGLTSVINRSIDKVRQSSGGLLVGDTTQHATNSVNDTLGNLGVDPSKISPDAYDGLRAVVKKSLDTGTPPDKEALTRLARAQSLPVPVPMTTGQITRDPMQFAVEQNIKGIHGVGEPITKVLGDQNKALIGNLDALGAKEGVDPITAGQAVIDSLKAADDKANQAVSSAYDAYKNATGRTLDVPLKGIAQDYARIMEERGPNIPPAVAKKFESYGLLSGKQAQTFTIDDAENLIKNYINKNYDPMNKPAAGALDELKASVQNAISQGAGQSAEGTAAAQLAKEARNAARERFQLIDNTPALKAAITDVQPDKFIQKYILGGNVGEIKNMVNVLGANDPQALSTLQNSVMQHIKGQVTGNATEGNAIFSQDKLKSFVRNPQMAARLNEVLGPTKIEALKQLHNVAEDAIYAPKASAVNTSNTASAAANIVNSALTNYPGSSLASFLKASKVPFVAPAAEAMQGKMQSKAAQELVNQAIASKVSQAPRSNYLSQLPGIAARGGAAYAQTRTQKRGQQ